MKTKFIFNALLIITQFTIYSQSSWSHTCGSKPLEGDQYG